MQTGLIPTLVNSLGAHAKLSQEFSDLHAVSKSIFHMKGCASEYSGLLSFMKSGELHHAVRAAAVLETNLLNAPGYLERTDVMKDLKVCSELLVLSQN
jgi:hypothetical protein